MSEVKKEFAGLSDDMLIDDIDDLPSFDPWPEGLYPVILEDGITDETVGDHKAKKVVFKLLAPGEVSDNNKHNLKAPIVGDECQLVFMKDNEFGAGNFKKIISPIAQFVGVKTVGEACQQSKGVKGHAFLTVRPGKKGTDKEDRLYQDIKEFVAGTV